MTVHKLLNRRFSSVNVVVMLAVVWFVVLPLAINLCEGIFGWRYDTSIRKRGVTNPAQDFALITGLTWPRSAKVVEADDSHWDGKSGPLLRFGPGLLDGELHIVFETTPAVLKEWLSRPAPWGETWQDGPVPKHILGNTHFESFEPQRIKFAARERASAPRSPGFEFWDGELIVLDIDSGRVWLSSWDK